MVQGCRSALASRTAIVVTGLAILSISAATAWMLHSGVGSATAQSGTQLASRMPEAGAKTAVGDYDQANWEAAANAPRLAGITIETGQPSVVEGIAPPRSMVSLIGNGQLIGQSLAKADGSWQITVERGFARGDHRLLVRASIGHGLADRLSDMVRVSTPSGIVGPLVVLFPTAAEMASPVSRVPSGVAMQTAAVPSLPVVRVAEVSASSGSAVDTLGGVREWLQRADRSYNDVVIKKLSAGPDGTAVLKTSGPAIVVAQATPPTPKPGAGDNTAGNSVVDGMLNWLKRSSDTYQKAIVKRLAEPGPTLESLEAKAKADEAKKAADAKVGEDAQQSAREELRAAQAKRDAELKAAEVAKKATEEVAAKAPAIPPKVEDDAAKKVIDDKRIADEALKRRAELKAAEDKRATDQKAADDKRVADEAAKRAADLKAAEAKKNADDAAARDLAAKKSADDKRVADEAAKRAADQKVADAQKANDEIRRAQDVAQRTALEARRVEDMAREAEAKRQAELKVAEAARQAATVAKMQQAEAQRVAAAKAAEDVRRRGAELAEAASKEASSRLATQTPSQPKAPEPKPAAVAVAPSKSSVAATPDRLARVASPPNRRRAPIDTSTRSALGAGVGSHATARKSDEVGEDNCRKAGRRIKPPGYYIVKSGDSLWDIADLHYGDGARFGVIERANRRIGDPDLIKPCQRVFVPAPKRG